MSPKMSPKFVCWLIRATQSSADEKPAQPRQIFKLTAEFARGLQGKSEIVEADADLLKSPNSKA